MDDKELQHPRAGHEERDVNSVAITKFGIGLTITIVVFVFALGGLLNYFEKREGGWEKVSAQPPPPATDPRRQPPQPRLQQAPPVDLRDMRVAEDQLLQHYS